jgi:hypothetical protein
MMEGEMKKESIAAGVLSLGLVGLLLVGGCGREESATYSSPEGEVTVTSKEQGGREVVTVESGGGSLTVFSGPQSISEAELGVPLYPGAQLFSSAQMEQGGAEAAGAIASYSLTSGDGFDEVVAFYRANLKDVRQSMDQNLGGQKMAFFLVGKENQLKSVQVMSDLVEGKTAIQVTWLPEE